MDLHTFMPRCDRNPLKYLVSAFLLQHDSDFSFDYKHLDIRGRYHINLKAIDFMKWR